jgi:hypothetical protein
MGKDIHRSFKPLLLAGMGFSEAFFKAEGLIADGMMAGSAFFRVNFATLLGD